MIKDEIKALNRYKMFCTPGHKGQLLEGDVTEIDTSFPAECILDAEQKAAALYGAKRLRFLVAGSSVGVKAALLNSGDILTSRNCHKSVTDSAVLSKANAFFMESDTYKELVLPPTKRQLLSALKKYPSVKTVVLTTPDYYGLMAGEDVAKAVVKEGLRLHIDAAHGAHMFVRPDLFDTGIFKYAHTFNVSAHKTLRAYTGTAYLAINDADSIERVENNLDLLSSTSPFYPFMAGLEDAYHHALDNKGVYDGLFAAIKRLKKRVKCAKNDDPTRLVVDASAYGISGENLYTLIKEQGIIAEKFDARYVVFIITLCDSVEAVDSLADTLVKIKDNL